MYYILNCAIKLRKAPFASASGAGSDIGVAICSFRVKTWEATTTSIVCDFGDAIHRIIDESHSSLR